MISAPECWEDPDLEEGGVMPTSTQPYHHPLLSYINSTLSRRKLNWDWYEEVIKFLLSKTALFSWFSAYSWDINQHCTCLWLICMSFSIIEFWGVQSSCMNHPVTFVLCTITAFLHFLHFMDPTTSKKCCHVSCIMLMLMLMLMLNYLNSLSVDLHAESSNRCH